MDSAVRPALRAVGVNHQNVTDIPARYENGGVMEDILVTYEHGANPKIHIEYDDCAGCYHKRTLEIDTDATRNTCPDGEVYPSTLVARPDRRVGGVVRKFIENKCGIALKRSGE